MKRIDWILKHPLYLSSYHRLEELEKDRIFCRHQLPHLLDVARIAYIRNLEQQLHIPKPVIYAASILHDIGKGEQYTRQLPHEIASYEIAKTILAEMPETLCFSPEEQTQILAAIRNHRSADSTISALDKLIFESDKASRNCFCCPAKDACNWNETKKNMEIMI